jgi:hypothetical protein
MYAAKSHLAESFIGVRARDRERAIAELKRATAWWPALPLLPAFYPYAARVVLRLVLGESRYGRFPRPRRRAPSNAAKPERDSGADFVEVCRAENGVEAHLLKAALEAAGIPAHVTEESTAALRPNLWWAAPRVLVPPERAAEAAQLVRELQASKSAGPT